MNESSEKPTCLPYVQPLDHILCFTLEIREIPRNQGFCLMCHQFLPSIFPRQVLLASATAQPAVRWWSSDTVSIVSQRWRNAGRSPKAGCTTATEQKMIGSPSIAHQSAFSDQKSGGLDMVGIWLVWLDCELWDLNLRIYENLRMELLHTYCIIPPILWKEPGNPAASAYSNWPWTSLRPEKAPARFSQRANVANSAETGFNWKLGRAGTDGNHRTLG